MRRRIICLLLCLIMILAIPCSGALAADGSTKNYVDSGRLSYGTATLCAPDGTTLKMDYVYSQKLTLTEKNAAKLAETLDGMKVLLQGLLVEGQLYTNEGFFMVSVSDGDALEDMIAAMEDVSSGDVSVSAADTSLGGTQTGKDDNSDADELLQDGTVTESDSGASAAVSEFAIPDNDKATLSLERLVSGVAEFEVGKSLAASFRDAFPEFTFGRPETVEMSAALAQTAGVSLANDRLSAVIDIDVEPEVVEREIYGETYTLLMVSNDSYRYTFEQITLSGNAGGVTTSADGAATTVTTPTDAVTTTTEQSTTTTTTTKATTTANTTTTTVKITTTTTKAATTISTTTTSEKDVSGSGYVCTRKKNLRVRTGPGFEYRIITTIPKGTRLEVLSRSGDWYRVRLSNGTLGYCYSMYIALD